MRIAAPAKVNLALHVTGQRADGYHTLESLVAFAKAGDVIIVGPAQTDTITFSGPFGATLAAETGTNLVLRARDALRDAAGSRPCPPVALHLEKNLPLSSGIGGGSADAAAALKGLNMHWHLGLSMDALCVLGLPLGADVPMCLHGRPLIAEGIGETIKPVDLPDFHMLLVNPGVAVSTPAIFRALSKKDNEGLPSIPPLWGEMSPQATGRGMPASFIAALRSTRNDLQPPAIALEPVIAEVIGALEANGALFARMSGSGATCFGIFATDRAVEKAAAEIRLAHPGWWVA